MGLRKFLNPGLFLIFLILLILPENLQPISGLNPLQSRVFAIFILAVGFWVFEPFPPYATALGVIFLELILISDRAPYFLRLNSTQLEPKLTIPFQTILGTLSSPIIILVLGGFFLALGSSRFRLEGYIASKFLTPFGTQTRFVLLGVMGITAFLSMFMSNTATTALMIAVLLPILLKLKENDPARIAFCLAIPFSSNIGGIATPIGTPPNAIGMKYLSTGQPISFLKWMGIALPFVLVLLFATWIIFLFLYPPSEKKLNLELDPEFPAQPQARWVFWTILGTIFLWLTTDFHGMNSYIIAFFPVLIFSLTGIVGPNELKKISWDVLWLLSGGLALGMALETSGLSNVLISKLPLSQFSPFFLVFFLMMVTVLMATFMSNTATANLLLPLCAVLVQNLSGVEFLGGGKSIIMAITFSSSLAMALPISTPPNAMAFATGLISTKEMTKVGILVGLIGILLITLEMFILGKLGGIA